MKARTRKPEVPSAIPVKLDGRSTRRPSGVHTSRTSRLFLAELGHELRTPLSAIVGLAEVLLDETYGSLNEKQRRVLDTIRVSGSHAIGLVTDLKSLALVETRPLENKELRVCDLIDECIALLEVEIDRRQQKLFLDCDSSIRIHGDPRGLKQIMINLVGNATKFAGEDGVIRLDVHRDASRPAIVIEVSDSGPGVAKEDQKRIFDPFVVLDSSNDAQGTGLGLTVVKALVDRMGGSLGVKSVRGAGATFFVRLPTR